MKFDVPVLINDKDPAGLATRWAFQSVECMEATSAEAPVVATLTSGVTTSTWRRWNGRLWLAAEKSGAGPVCATAVASGLKDLVAGRHIWSRELSLIPTDPRCKLGFNGVYRSDGKVGAQAVDSRAGVAERAAMTLFVDDELYTLSPGPVAALTFTRGGFALYWRKDLDLASSRCGSFTMSEAEHALDVAAEILMAGVHWSPDRAGPRLMGDLPAAPMDVAANCAEGAAAALLFHMRAPRLPGASRAAIAALVDFRELYHGRWPHMATRMVAGENSAWAFEKDRIDWPDAAALIRCVREIPDELVDMSSMAGHIKIAQRRIDYSHRPDPEPDGDLEAIASLRM